MVDCNHHTMPEFTWDHFKADLTLSWSGFQISRREKRIGPVWVKCLSWVLLAVVRRWGHRKRTRLAGLISVVRLGWRRMQTHASVKNVEQRYMFIDMERESRYF